MTVEAPAPALRARRIPAGIVVPVLALGADADMLLGTRILPAAAWLAVFAVLASPAHAGHGGAWLPLVLTAVLIALSVACLLGSLRTLRRWRTPRTWLAALASIGMCAAAVAMLA